MAKRGKQPVLLDPTAAPWPAVDTDTRQQDIALSAYYRAEARGFATGGELEDWLDAEREIAGYDADE